MAKQFTQLVSLLFVLTLCNAVYAGVVINEIFYNAPNDLDSLQWIELYNPDDQAVDVSNWTLNKGKLYLFAPESIIEPHEFIVVALQPDVFSEHYNTSVIGPLKRSLSHNKDQIELIDAQGNQIDKVRYKDSHPWPVSADGYSASLERICPISDGDDADNWAASPLPTDTPKPAGTPGKPNSNLSSSLPPIISKVTAKPEEILTGQPLRVEAKLKLDNKKPTVRLLYSVISKGIESQETAIQMMQDGTSESFFADIPAQPAHTIVRYRIQAENISGAKRTYPAKHDLRPTFSAYVHDPWELAKIPLGYVVHVGTEFVEQENPEPLQRPSWGNFLGFGRRQEEPPRPPRGLSAFVYVDHQTGETTIFDHINIIDRFNNRGLKAFFHKDHKLKGMKSINISFEGNERFILAEPLAYDLYNRAGQAAPQTEFLRLWVNGKMSGYHLIIERPNRTFLRRNNIDEDGDLFKMRWMGRDITSKFEKKTNPHSGHENLIALLDKLKETEDQEQWDVIQNHFNVDQVATYFALNMILSHWDGFFNNHFVYHDIAGKNKWEIYPWDQDKTWGYYDGIADGDVFFDMPLTYGMEGDQRPGGSFRPPRDRNSMRPQGDEQPRAENNRPPRGEGFNPPNEMRRDRPSGQGFRRPDGETPDADMRGMFRGMRRGGAMWWREGGDISKPLLANPQFRDIFIKRTKEILETLYTQDIYFPLIDDMADRLKDDVKLLAKLYGEEENDGIKLLNKNVESLKTHLQKRREFLLKELN